MATLPFKIEKIEDLPEALQKVAADNELYKEVKDKKTDAVSFVLNLDDSMDEKTAGLVANRNGLLTDNAQLKQKLAAVGDLDTIAQARAALELKPDLEAKIAESQEQLKNALDKKPDVEAIKRDLQVQFDGDLKKVNDNFERMKAAAKGSALQNAITAAFDENAVTPVPGIRSMLLAAVRDNLIVEEQISGDNMLFAPRVRNLDNNATGPYRLSTKANSDGHMTVTELVAEYKENPDFGFAFSGTKANGGESTNSGTKARAGDIGIEFKDQLKNLKEKVAFVSKHGSEAFEALATRPPSG